MKQAYQASTDFSGSIVYAAKAMLPPEERDKKVITYHSFFPPYPSNEERQNALGTNKRLSMG